MTAILRVREVGAREFVQHNGEFEDNANDTGETLAIIEGERLTSEGNVEAFEVWSRVAAKQRVWKLEDMK